MRFAGATRRAVLGLATVAAAAVSLASCGGAPASTTLTTVPVAAAASTETSEVAAIPMGLFSEPSNTFWELLVALGSRWAVETPPNVATNGGIVAVAGDPGDLLAGVLPSQYLVFSPLARSGDLGRRWDPGVLDEPLVAAPSSLATTARRAVALVGSSDPEVVGSTSSLATWSTLGTLATLAGALGASCHLVALTAVVVVGHRVLVGGGCEGTDATALPLVELTHGAWRGVGPTADGLGPTEVLRLWGTSRGVAALVLAQVGGVERLDLVTGSPTLASWRSHVLVAHLAGSVVATATSSTGEAGVVVRTATGALEALEATPRFSILREPAPPSGTQTLAVVPGVGLEALAVHRSVLSVFVVRHGVWHPLERLFVAIPYGSSG